MHQVNFDIKCVRFQRYGAKNLLRNFCRHWTNFWK